ncbi:hypothetical protein TPB0596_32120 [Tsukamurella pulmonis]|uniref:hypothetical protein n=1 Tax=Tsukamurella pulmonis TaxID=47312 RepID=UPI001EDFCB7B|nr:hypothetical protein [Tsukamurella pulmonis]BDD83449.1 hypothetical protein TPB0596_32120 [Tsukamurella pulmonis]
MSEPDFPKYMPGNWNRVGRKLFERFSNDSGLPNWQRIAFYCYAHMRRDNHCPIPAGFLADLLGCSDAHAARYVKSAVAKGWLAHGSTVRCLVAPIEVSYGAGNYVAKDCPHH